MIDRSPTGFWLQDAGAVEPRPPLQASTTADVCVVGGGYLGLWTALRLRERGVDVVLLERDVCGEGPSGRNGGFCEGYDHVIGSLTEQFGAAEAERLRAAAARAVEEVGAFCAEHAPRAAFTWAPRLEVASGPAQDGLWREEVEALARAGRGHQSREVSPEEAARIVASPRIRGGAVLDGTATVHPGFLARGLREHALDRGVRVHERTRVTRLDDREDGVRLTTDAGATVRARRAVVAINAASVGLAPFARDLSVASSHMVATAPVPHVLEEVGWTQQASVCDCRTMLHYLRPTPDDRIAFGWGGGRMGYGARRAAHLEDDHGVQDHVAAQLRSWFPGVRPDEVTHAWGGPIDVSADHLPRYEVLRSTVAGFGFTGNGVGPTRLGGRILADLALDERTDDSTLPLVGRPPRRFPPEPARALGGSLVRRAMLAVDAADDAGRAAPAPVRLAAGLPRRMGFSLPR